MPQFSRLMCAALAAVSGLVLSPWPAAANAQAQPGRVEYAPTMVVLDASGSMAGADPGGGTKMDAAKRATRTLIGAAPDGAPIGLAVYGTNTGSTDAEKQAGCRDVTVLRGPQQVDKPALTAAVDGLRPRGYTPIGTALQVAADALPDAGPRSIVLVSDGIDTCAPPDPCEVAKQLRGAGVDLVVHTVGFGVDEAARKQLTCVAQATGGTYTDAPDARSLDRVLPRVTNTALRNYQPAGIPVTGTVEQRTAPDLRLGQYVDVLRRDRETFYAVDVPENTTVYVAATMIYSRNTSSDFGGLGITLYDVNGANCNVGEFESGTFSGGESITAALVFEGNASCPKAGRFVVGLKRTYDTDHPEQLPVEIQVGLEPQVRGDKGQPGVDEPVSFHEPGGPDRPVSGGASFGTAATLDESGRYTDVVHAGEFTFYRVYLDWGQALAARIEYRQEAGDPSRNIRTALVSPFRSTVGQPNKVDNTYATPPIRYLNRDIQQRDVSVAGWYYLMIGFADFGDEDAVPVTLDLVINGQLEPGPDYASELARTAGVFGHGDPRLAKAGPPTDQPQPAADGERSSFPTAVVLGIAGGVVLLALVIGLVLIGRRRATSRGRG